METLEEGPRVALVSRSEYGSCMACAGQHYMVYKIRLRNVEMRVCSDCAIEMIRQLKRR
jgi:hypothetical protein